MTRTIPNLGRPGAREAWAKLEAAKRRTIHQLLGMGLPLVSKENDPMRGLTFEFLADPEPGSDDEAMVLTGHDEGLITINIAEADDAERERRRAAMKEGYRTLVGHFRHELGHYYWDRLVQEGGAGRLEAFRELFGDEREDYAEAMARHHSDGPPPKWYENFVSAYASSHPWEDWAETWAHCMHMCETLETAAACGLTLRPRRSDEPTLKQGLETAKGRIPAFDQLISRWQPLTYVMNNLNRGMGLPDAYPFVLTKPAVDKLRFVHELISAVG